MLSKFANFSQKYASDFTESQPTTSTTPTILNTTENNFQATNIEGKKIIYCKDAKYVGFQGQSQAKVDNLYLQFLLYLRSLGIFFTSEF